jgi:trk system potassium uptake protein TrkA
MNKYSNPQIAVIGLGAFGMALVKTLINDDADLIVVDNDMNHLDEIKEMTKQTVCFDATDSNQLKSHGITDVDIAVIAIGENFEAVVLITMELINAGVGKIYARANSAIQEQILEKIGVTEIIHPERQVAERIGSTIQHHMMVDLLELGGGISVFEVDVSESMVDYSLEELNLRERYKVNVITIKRPVSNQKDSTESTVYESIGIPDGKTTLKSGDKLILTGHKEDCKKMIDLN